MADATQLPYQDESFDISTSFSALEHIPGRTNRQKAFDEMARVTKKGGYVVITVPNKWSFFSVIHRRLMKQGKSDYGYGHLYTKRELKDGLRQAGLVPQRFTSELKITSSQAFAWMGYVSAAMSRFGDRIGYIAQKPA